MKKENKKFHVDALPVPELGTATYRGIQQLFKRLPEADGKPGNVFPVTYTQAVYDGKTGANLEHILHQFNFIWLQFQGTGQATRNLLPPDMRRRGITISYRNVFDNVVVERNVNESESTTDNWGLDEYWEEVHTAEEIRDWVLDYVTKYIDAKIEEVYTYIDGKIADTIIYIDESISNLDTSIRNWVNEQITNLESTLKTYVDNSISSLDSSIRSWVNTQISNLQTTIQEWVTNEINIAVENIDLSEYATIDWVTEQISGATYNLPTATSTVLGGVKLGSDTVQSRGANSVTSTASRTYAIQVNSSGQLVVNVPWESSEGLDVDLVTDGTGNNWLNDLGEYTNPFPIVSEEEVLTILPNQIVSHRPVEQMWTVIDDEVELTSAELNENYPNVAIGFSVVQFGIGKVYQKVTEVGQWIEYDVTLMVL